MPNRLEKLATIIFLACLVSSLLVLVSMLVSQLTIAQLGWGCKKGEVSTLVNCMPVIAKHLLNKYFLDNLKNLTRLSYIKIMMFGLRAPLYQWILVLVLELAFVPPVIQFIVVILFNQMVNYNII